MRERLKAFFKKLAQPAKHLPAPPEWMLTCDEAAMALLPAYCGANLAMLFARRQWGWFFFNLALTALVAGSTFFLFRMRRKLIAAQKDLIAALEAEHRYAADFFTELAMAADGRGKVLMEVTLHDTGPKPETNPARIN